MTFSHKKEVIEDESKIFVMFTNIQPSFGEQEKENSLLI